MLCLNHLFFMKKSSKLALSVLSIFVGIWITIAATSIIQGTIGSDLAPGQFLPSGNPGKITLMTESEANSVWIPGLTLEGDGTNAYLRGNWFLQTVWYVAVDSNNRVIPPDGAEANLTLPWEVRGLAWSENAGWITLESKNPNMYSWVYYLPISGSLTGMAWSDTLGYIDFSGNSSSGSELVARVKVIGNAGGVKSFESLFVASNGVMKTSSVLTPFINNVRKNVSILTRNATDSVVNSLWTTQKVLGNIMYYKMNGGSVSLSAVTNFCANNDAPRGLIVEGADIIIDRDVNGSNRSCSLIAVSNGTTGGNIYITSAPKVIMSYIVAEWTVFAGDNSTNLYNDTKVELANLPPKQLYILGWLISRNTIGGAMTETIARGACPFTEANCDRDSAIKYDLNFFRSYNKNPANRAYTKDNSLENFSFIIEYDARATGDIPPGL
jgi:hypothetical protein